jgi:hypothetical protein
MRKLGAFLQEIEHYYKKCKNEQGNLLVLSRPMVAFALSHLSEAALDNLFDCLVQEGQLLSQDPERMVFRRFYLDAAYTDAFSIQSRRLASVS